MPRQSKNTSGLARVAAARATRTVQRVAEAIATLRQRQEVVSLRRICDCANRSALIGESRLTESAITRNQDAAELYYAARPIQAQRTRIRPRRRAKWLERKTKAELIELILSRNDEIRKLRQIIEVGLGMTSDSGA